MQKTIALSFKPTLSEEEQVIVDESILGVYERSFVEAYMKKKKWYRAAGANDSVIHNEVTYDDMSKFAEKADLKKQFQKHVLKNNAHLAVTGGFSDTTWHSLWGHLFEHCQEAIDESILHKLQQNEQ